jgi:hypothetical protein
MGKRRRDRQPTMWVPTTELPTSANHPFYARLNRMLRDGGFDDFGEEPSIGISTPEIAPRHRPLHVGSGRDVAVRSC